MSETQRNPRRQRGPVVPCRRPPPHETHVPPFHRTRVSVKGAALVTRRHGGGHDSRRPRYVTPAGPSLSNSPTGRTGRTTPLFRESVATRAGRVAGCHLPTPTGDWRRYSTGNRTSIYDSSVSVMPWSSLGLHEPARLFHKCLDCFFNSGSIFQALVFFQR